jgi:preprotein translocase SecE subunit
MVSAAHGAPRDPVEAMAKQTRSQRKARRRQQAEAAAAVPQRARARQVRPEAEQHAHAEAAPRQVPGGGFKRFIEECWGELMKVEWPGQKQVMTGTVVVIIACAIVGTYLWGADLLLKRLVQNVILGQ